MLVKPKKTGTKVPSYDEHIGWLENDKVSYYGDREAPYFVKDELPKDDVVTEQIVKINALWVTKDLKVTCKVANTWDSKVQGLQGTKRLDKNEGMFFPYEPRSDVSFHQGSVGFPLDIIFLRNDEIVKIQAYTKVGSNEHWSCKDCDGVLEVNGGFCDANDVEVGDSIALFASSQADLDEFQANQLKMAKEASLNEERDNRSYKETFPLHLLSEIADSI